MFLDDKSGLNNTYWPAFFLFVCWAKDVSTVLRILWTAMQQSVCLWQHSYGKAESILIRFTQNVRFECFYLLEWIWRESFFYHGEHWFVYFRTVLAGLLSDVSEVTKTYSFERYSYDLNIHRLPSTVRSAVFATHREIQKAVPVIWTQGANRIAEQPELDHPRCT